MWTWCPFALLALPPPHPFRLPPLVNSSAGRAAIRPSRRAPTKASRASTSGTPATTTTTGDAADAPPKKEKVSLLGQAASAGRSAREEQLAKQRAWRGAGWRFESLHLFSLYTLCPFLFILFFNFF